MTKIQVGTIVYRDKQTNNFGKSKPLYMKYSFELVKAQKELLQSACNMFLTDLLIFAKYGF